MKNQILKEFKINLENFIQVIIMFNILYHIRGLKTSFTEIERLKHIFQYIGTEMKPEYNLAALEAIEGEFSILLDISRLTLLTRKQKDHYDETRNQI